MEEADRAVSVRRHCLSNEKGRTESSSIATFNSKKAVRSWFVRQSLVMLDGQFRSILSCGGIFQETRGIPNLIRGTRFEKYP